MELYEVLSLTHLTLPSYFSQDILFCEHLADGTSSRIDGEPEKPHLII